MLCTKGVTRASQNVLPSARAASSSGRKRLAKPCSCCSARFSLQQRPGSARCQGLEKPHGKAERTAGSLPCPLPRHHGSLAPLAPSTQGGPLAVPRACPQWPLGPSQPLPNGGCAVPVATRSCCAWPTPARMCQPLRGPASCSGGLAQLKPRWSQGGPAQEGPLVARKGPS